MNPENLDPGNENIDDAQRIARLIAGYIRHTLTDEERDELDEWVTSSDHNMRLFAEMTDEKNIEKGLKERNIYDPEQAVEQLKAKLALTQKRRISRKTKWLYYGIAASVLILIGTFFILSRLQDSDPTDPISSFSDLLPGSERATLTVANGQQIILDSVKGNILTVDSMKVVNEQGELSYMGTASSNELHVLSTPMGGQYKVTLSDGTVVWLNAASSLRYPPVFDANERRVEINGEAYFEVAKDPARKFIVTIAGKGQVEVLGTQFNVNAYLDEPVTKITLLEGLVGFSPSIGGSSRDLKPGQQLSLQPNGDLTLISNADLEEIVAWKNGVFEFKDEPIEAIMRQVARWYNVTVKYEGNIAYHFNASIDRKVPVSKLFHLLELNENVHFSIHDKIIIVKP